jgi:hypothetical protein
MQYLKLCEPGIEAALQIGLGQLAEFKSNDWQASLGDPCGVLMAHGGKVRAIWHAGHDMFHFIPENQPEPAVVVHSIAEAISLTKEMLMPGGRLRARDD